MRIFLKVIAGISVILLVILIGAFLLFYIAGNAAEKEISNFKPELEKLSDGDYHGSYSFLGSTKAEISFRIANGELLRVELHKLTGTPGYGADYTVKTKIKNSRDLDFDAVSGATITSNFAKAAIKNAIEENKKD